MRLGIEIGGTKLQFGVAEAGQERLSELVRREVAREMGGAGIRESIRTVTRELSERYPLEAIGIGFGGPVRADEGRVITSHQIEGWDNFPLAEWCRQEFGLPTIVGNDCDVAALAEAERGAGRGSRIVLYVTVGTGIGGGLVVDGHIYGRFRPAALEIGHLRPGLGCRSSDDTVESRASGRGIEAAAQAWLFKRAEQPASESNGHSADDEDAADLLQRCGQVVSALSARQIGEAALAGNRRARTVLASAVETLGWAIAQAATLTAPETVIVGGGVSLLPNSIFLDPLRATVRQFLFPPLVETVALAPAALSENVVVHGALLLADSMLDASAET